MYVGRPNKASMTVYTAGDTKATGIDNRVKIVHFLNFSEI